MLLADDNEPQRRLAVRHFQLRGYQVVEARDGLEALALAQLDPPDAVVSDVLMPGIDGVELCLRLRQAPDLANLPVVLMSAFYDTEKDAEAGYAAGATAFVQRTHDFADVFAALERVLERPPGPVELPDAEDVHARWSARLQAQVERLAARNLELARRSSMRDTELFVLTRIAETLAERGSLQATLSEVLGAVVEQCGIAFAVVYSPSLGGWTPFVLSPGDSVPSLPADDAFAPVLGRAAASAHPLVIPEHLRADEARPLLRALGVVSALLVPLRLQGVTSGLLLLGSSGRDLADPALGVFARTVGTHLAHALRQAPPRSRDPAGDPTADRLRALAGLVAELTREGRNPPAGLSQILAGRSEELDLREVLEERFGGEAVLHLPRIPVHGVRGALAWALGQIITGLVGSGALRPITGLVSGTDWCLQVTASGGAPIPSVGWTIAEEVVRRHGGELSPRPLAGARGLVLRIPALA